MFECIYPPVLFVVVGKCKRWEKKEENGVTRGNVFWYISNGDRIEKKRKLNQLNIETHQKYLFFCIYW